MFLRKSSLKRRGVSIENVGLGLVVVLIFAGLLYGAFSVLSNKIEVRQIQSRVSTISNEINLLHQQMGGEAFDRQYGAMGVANLLRYLENVGASDVPLMNGNAYARSLPHDGMMQISSTRYYTQMVLGWDRSRTRATRNLCHALAGPKAFITNMQQYNQYLNDPSLTFESMGLNDGPLGQNYLILLNDCDGDLGGYPMFRIVYTHEQMPTS